MELEALTRRIVCTLRRRIFGDEAEVETYPLDRRALRDEVVGYPVTLVTVGGEDVTAGVLLAMAGVIEVAYRTGLVSTSDTAVVLTLQYFTFWECDAIPTLVGALATG
jgi:hypothetical protein